MNNYTDKQALKNILLESDESLVYWLQQHAVNFADDVAIHVIKKNEEVIFNYAEFVQRIKALAVELIKTTEKGDRAILLFDNDENYAISFFACLFAGVIAVPVFPPQSPEPKQIQRLVKIIKDADANLVLTTNAIKPMIAMFGQQFGVTNILATDGIEQSQFKSFDEENRGLHDIAFLQYTSGSTGSPKGVMVTHANLVANQQAILRLVIDTNANEDFFVSWLPMYHDMGLIGGLLAPLYRATKLIFMSPLMFLKNPEIWLKTISKYRGTITAAPDFAYRLCYERISDETIAELDLSCLKIMFSGAEPVREETLKKFSDRFKICGFDPVAFLPCYGLAETTLFVSGTPMLQPMKTSYFDAQSLENNIVNSTDENANKAHKLVSNGLVDVLHPVRITDVDGITELADNQIGEVLISGDSVTKGYWRNEEATANAFLEVEGKRWVRSGDLGFLYEGELYITGRIKDLIILNGSNYYPQDFEQSIENELEILKQGRTVAFAVQTPEGGEGVGVAVEIEKSMQKLISAEAIINEINHTVAQQCQQPASVVLLLDPKSIPKTSSGKLQRSACRIAWQEGSLACFAKQEFGELYTKESGNLVKKKQ